MGQRLLIQLSYLSPWQWLVQFFFLLGLGWYWSVGFFDEYFLTMAAAGLGLSGAIEIQRSYRFEMWELEQACRYNLRELFALRMLLLGGMDLGILLLTLGVGLAQGQGVAVCLYLLIPALLSDGFYLYLLQRLGRRCESYALTAAGVLLSVLFFWLRSFMELEAGIYAWVAQTRVVAALVLLSAGFLIFMILTFWKKTKEEALWNCDWRA